MISRSNWLELWQELPSSGADPSMFDELVECYSQPHRKYHTMQHLGECLQYLRAAWAMAEQPAEIAVALWFHDAIYETRRKDNEEMSAAWARDHALSRGVSPVQAGRIFDLVMMTRHDAVPTGDDAKLMVDIDLAILGAASPRFDEYDRQVRQEYWWVPGLVYRRERRRILQSFIDRQAIYATTYFRDLLEQQARGNIARALEAL
jgi:predicted metal-dependent HD superfamily phosphohydrolase